MNSKNNVLWLCIAGAVTGFINGFFGGGGGMIIVPILTVLLGFSTKTAHASAIAVILPVTVFSAVTYVATGSVELQSCIPVTVGVFIGGAVGAVLLKKLQPKVIIKLFSLVMVAAGVKLLFF